MAQIKVDYLHTRVPSDRSAEMILRYPGDDVL